jgi:uncharacterized protein (DUF362 family)
VPIKIGVSSGNGRYGNIRGALEALEDDFSPGTRIVIKPNFVSTTIQSAATHVEAVRAVVDFLQERTKASIKIAEGAALGDTFEGFRNFGYLDLKKEYSNLEFVDLNRDIFETVSLKDKAGNSTPFRVAQTVLRSDLRISVTPPKTHDTVGVTLAIKNMLVGSLIRNARLSSLAIFWKPFHWLTKWMPGRIRDLFSFENLTRLFGTRFIGSDKVKLHQGYLNLNLFLFQLSALIPPHLSVIDGFEGMEGDGPIHGAPVPLDWALAGTNPLMVDRVTTRLMGFNPEDIGYLTFLTELLQAEPKEKISFVGDSPQGIGRPFKPHRNFVRQQGWKKELAEIGDTRLTLGLAGNNPDILEGRDDGEADSDSHRGPVP